MKIRMYYKKVGKERDEFLVNSKRRKIGKN